MRINNIPDSKYGDYLCLGVQTSPGTEKRNALWKARVWAPKNAKSFTITEFRFTDYHGRSVETFQGYASFEVEYFTTRKEGKFRIYQNFKFDSFLPN